MGLVILVGAIFVIAQAFQASVILGILSIPAVMFVGGIGLTMLGYGNARA